MKKMISVKNRSVALATLILLLFSTTCAFGSPAAHQVEKYCDLDFKGARITGKNYSEVRQLMAWSADQDEPGWDCFRIIRDFKIVSEEVDGSRAKVMVEYNIVAGFCGSYELDAKQYKEVVPVELIKNNDSWKVKNYILYPRISIETALEYLDNKVKKMESGHGDAVELAKIRQLITNITKLKK